MKSLDSSLIDNSVAAVAGSIAVLTVVGLVSWQIWNYAYSVSIAWVISDLVLSVIVIGGEGWLKIPFVSEDFQNKGRGYVAFLIGIITATWLSSWIADSMLGWAGILLKHIPVTNSTITPLLIVVASNPTLFTILIANCIVAALVFLDLNARFYKKPKSG